VHEAQWQWRSTPDRRACHPAAVEGGGGGAELGVVVGGGGGTIAISDHRRGGATAASATGGCGLSEVDGEAAGGVEADPKRRHRG
jgi:hypothetical protein